MKPLVSELWSRLMIVAKNLIIQHFLFKFSKITCFISSAGYSQPAELFIYSEQKPSVCRLCFCRSVCLWH